MDNYEMYSALADKAGVDKASAALLQMGAASWIVDALRERYDREHPPPTVWVAARNAAPGNTYCVTDYGRAMASVSYGEHATRDEAVRVLTEAMTAEGCYAIRKSSDHKGAAIIAATRDLIMSNVDHVDTLDEEGTPSLRFSVWEVEAQ